MVCDFYHRIIQQILNVSIITKAVGAMILHKKNISINTYYDCILGVLFSVGTFTNYVTKKLAPTNKDLKPNQILQVLPRCNNTAPIKRRSLQDYGDKYS